MFKFEIGQEVTIIALSRPGHVRAINISKEATTYWVHYWNNGERYQEWVYEEEIERKT